MRSPLHPDSQAIAQVIQQLNCDLLCLQEVRAKPPQTRASDFRLPQVDHYTDFWQPLLDSLQYEYVFAPRAEPAKQKGTSLCETRDQFPESTFLVVKADGCLIAWRRSVFEAVPGKRMRCQHAGFFTIRVLVQARMKSSATTRLRSSASTKGRSSASCAPTSVTSSC